MIKKKASPVYIEQIAELLVVGQFYTAEQFAKLTGIKSAKSRLDKLTSQGSMLRAAWGHIPKWVMTEECKARMIEIGKENKIKYIPKKAVPTSEFIIAIKKLNEFTLNDLRDEIKNKTGILMLKNNVRCKLNIVAKESLTIKRTEIKIIGAGEFSETYKLMASK